MVDLPHAAAGPRASIDRAAARPGPDLLDRTWDFFASVRVATVLMFLLAAAAVAGTLIEQEGQYRSWLPPEQFYPQRYGPVAGPLLMRLGLTHAYQSWWFMALLGMVAASLLVCSIQRGVPLYHAIHRPNVAPNPGFLHFLRHRLSAPAAGPDPLAPTASALRRAGYRVIRRDDGLLAERGRWSRWGPYILHLGLLVILAGGISRALPGWYSQTTLWLRDGETARVPGTDFYLKNERFTAEFYPDGRPRTYATAAVVIADGQEVRRQVIRMNEPLAYGGVELYQSSYSTDPGSADVVVVAGDGGGGTRELGRFALDLANPAASYTAGEVTLQVADYYPDFTIDAQGRPSSRSGNPNNPAVLFRVDGHDRPIWFFAQFPELQIDPQAPYRFRVEGMTERNSTGLQVKRDRGLPLIWAGLLIVSLGTALTFYLSHQRIWALVAGERVLIAGQTNRDKNALARALRRLAAALPGATVDELGG